MAFDKATRNRLASFVSEARRLIADEFTQKLQSIYGISDTGGVTPVDQLSHLDDSGLAIAALLRDRIEYLVNTHPDDKDGTKAAVERLAREQAFTILNRLAAIRMAEKRGLIVESVGKGYQSKGFKVFEQVAGSGLGDIFHRYRRYLFCLFDELAVDLGSLFDRSSPQALLFPRESALLALIELINAADIDSLWTEDETIGWIYQYYNDPVERKQMRDDSSSPRNSRELAIRNQFFTPRYVVEFLTDNTLGSIWYEMTRGETSLKESCQYLVRRPQELFLKPDEVISDEQSCADESTSQEELLKKSVHIPHRQLKDPRTLRMLDPACGSMHFGLYAFDLYEQIYEEAWDLELQLGVSSFLREASLNPLTETYSDKEAFLHDVPRLIIGHNIHGIDIDPRATQIAGLSLWLRAQRSWHSRGVKPTARPRITQSNIVCAEPMPGDKKMLREFTSNLEVPALGYLVEQVFDKMQLAGEAGSLLKIEEEIRDSIAEAKRQWKSSPKPKQMDLFGTEMSNPEQTDLPLNFTGITDERFWEEAEEKLYQALKEYAEVAGGQGYQRRLFAEDAARGFAFIDLCRKRYDAVLMNPPFGEPSIHTLNYFRNKYLLAADNLLVAFITRYLDKLQPLGRLGSITDRSFINKRFYEDFRREFIISKGSLGFWLDLGWNVLDANVEVAAQIFTLSKNANTMFLNVSNTEKKEETIKDSIRKNINIIQHNLSSFNKFPGLAIAYDLASPLVDSFAKGCVLSDEEFKSFGGLKSGDSESLFRLIWEVPRNSLLEKEWSFFQNGSSFSPYYYGGYYAVRSDKNSWKNVMSYDSSRITNIEHYYKPGIFYGKRTDWMYGYVGRANQVPSMEGHLILSYNAKNFWKHLAVINCSIYQEIVNKLCGQHKYAGYINPISLEIDKLPNPEGIEIIVSNLEEIDSANETSQLFIAPSLIVHDINREYSLSKSIEHVVNLRNKLVGSANDFRAKYNAKIEKLFNWSPLNEQKAPSEVDYVRNLFEFSNDANLEALNIVSYLLGCTLGRWDIRFATGKKPIPERSNPLAPVPICPPGMLQNAQGLEALPQDLPDEYPLSISWPGILVDDEGHMEDVVSRVRKAIEVIWGERAGDIEHELCTILSVRSLRDYFNKPSGFFADHVKRYSKSRRQAPIYLPLTTANGSYTLWIYYPRLTDQTLHVALADFVDPKIKSNMTEIRMLRETGNQRVRLEELLDLEKELADFHDEIERIIKLPWKPNLNDGVLITASPLWKLFRLPKWQRDLKSCWDKLEKGEFDWANLAYSVWPKRVENVCKKDRSIAIAHNLEHLCQKSNGKKSKKKNSEEDYE